MKKFPKIAQFNNVVKSVIRHATFTGLDDEGNPIYNNDPRIFPTIEFKGTTKIHGTNAGVILDLKDNKIGVQSRKYVLSKTADHYGFVHFVYKNAIPLTSIIASAIAKELVYNENSVIKPHVEKAVCTLFGEWAGPGIQGGVGTADLPEKMLFIFGLHVRWRNGEDVDGAWINPEYIKPYHPNIHNIQKFGVHKLDIDFKNPKIIVPKLIELTNEVERQCPVAKAFGISGIGEGIVWEGVFKGTHYRFKVKGEKHSTSKVKKLASVNVEKLTSIQEFVNYAITNNRVMQAVKETSASEKKDVPNVLRWVANDVIEEEFDTLSENDLTWKDVSRAATTRAREIFFEYLMSNYDI